MHLLTPKGFRAGAVYAGIKSKKTPDVGLLTTDRAVSAAAVFTTNKVVAAPVVVGRENIRSGKLQAIIVNAGNANACTGKKGLADAREMCRIAGELLQCPAESILPGSTGIIGRPMPMGKVASGIAGAFADLGTSREHALRFADAILTTDLKRKQAAATVTIDRQKITIAGVCKGSGMIGPRMALPQATMLGYLTTDAQIAAPLLRKLMSAACDRSFNAVTVDDHTSTNDTAAILASGASGARVTPANAPKFASALNEICESLAYQIAADGEGATKVVRIEVTGAKTELDAKQIARTIANSPLVKTAMHGNDPNWGRIVSAAGYAGVPFDPDRAVLTLQKTVVFRRGQPVPIDETKVSASMKTAEVQLHLNCNAGNASAICWTCDLSREYITINADYHT